MVLVGAMVIGIWKPHEDGDVFVKDGGRLSVDDNGGLLSACIPAEWWLKDINTCGLRRMGEAEVHPHVVGSDQSFVRGMTMVTDHGFDSPEATSMVRRPNKSPSMATTAETLAAQAVYVNDQFLNWNPENWIKVRIISARAYHSLFMHNMCIRPTPEELGDYTPDITIYNAGQFPCNCYTHCMTSSTSIDLNIAKREMVILDTQYAGEMKKGLFGVMHYLIPKR